jgi:hypothetical protein
MRMLFLPDFTVARAAHALRRKPRAGVPVAQPTHTAASAAAVQRARAEKAAQAAQAAAELGVSREGEGAGELSLADADPVLVWTAGVRFPDAEPAERAVFDQNRVEVLRLLTVLGSGTLYATADAFDPETNPWLLRMTRAGAPHAATVFASLLNTACAYDPYSLTPYGGSIFTDYREGLVDASLHALLVLLDFAPFDPDKGRGTDAQSHLSRDPQFGPRTVDARGPRPDEADPEEAPTEGKADSPGAKPAAVDPAPLDGRAGEPPPPRAASGSHVPARPPNNAIRAMLASLSGARDFRFVFEGLCRLLNNVHEANNTYMPNSLKQIQCHQEALVLLWKLLDENRPFMAHVLKYEDVTRLLAPLCYFMFQGRNDPAQAGLIHICTFLLLLLSGERNFGVALNKPYAQGSLPLALPLFEGTHADLLVVVVHKLIVDGSRKLKTLHNCLLTVVANVSPYCKSLGSVASVKLLSLFEIFSSRRFLLRSAGAHQYLGFLLDVFNNLIQYQYEGSLHLIYAIVRRKARFEALVNLELDADEAAAAKKGGGEEEKTAKTQTAKSGGGGADGGGADGKRGARGGGSGRGRFVPTTRWLDGWKARLPLDPVMRVLHYLEPQVKFLCRSDGSIDESGVLRFLKNTTMVGLLPCRIRS